MIEAAPDLLERLEFGRVHQPFLVGPHRPEFARGHALGLGGVDDPAVLVFLHLWFVIFAADLRTLAFGTDDQRGVAEAIQADVWDSLDDDTHRSTVREAVFDGRQVVTVGQGSSASVAQWLSQQLRQREGVPAIANTAAALPRDLLHPDDVLIAISQNGETTSVLNLWAFEP